MVVRQYRVTVRDALEAHEHALVFGGLPGIRSMDLIESAVGRPYTGYYPSRVKKAAALLQSLAQNHGFVDGNKRTALLIVTLFISRSHCRLVPRGRSINQEIEQLILDVVENRMQFDDIVAWFRDRLRKS